MAALCRKYFVLRFHEVCKRNKTVLTAPLTVGGKYGLLEGVCLCVRHLQDENKGKGLCAASQNVPKRTSALGG